LLFRRFTSWGVDMTRDYVKALECVSFHTCWWIEILHHREEVETLRHGADGD